MLGIIGLVIAALGAAFAQVADRVPAAHVKLVETSAGATMIAGLMLVGSTLPVVVL